MFQNFTHFYSFIEVMIALTIFLVAWDKPQVFISTLFTDKILPKQVVFKEIVFKEFFLKYAEDLRFVSDSIFKLGRYWATLSIPYAIVILLIASSCNYDKNIAYCNYQIFDLNESTALIFHLCVISGTLLFYILALLIGIFHAGVLFITLWLIKLSEMLFNGWKKHKKRRQILSELEKRDEGQLDELLEKIKNQE